MGAEFDRIHAAGGEVIAISGDDERRQAGMFARWKSPHHLFVSDPGGERFLQPLELWDPHERGGIGLPGMLVIAPDGAVAYRYVGRDYADRTVDSEIYEALEALSLDAIAAQPGGPIAEASELDDLDSFFRPDWYGPYFRGNLFGAGAIKRRIRLAAPDTTDTEQAIAEEHRQMAEDSLVAWKQLRSAVPPA